LAPAASNALVLMFPLGDGVMAVEEGGNGGLLRVDGGKVEILREATFAAPTLCFPANPHLKCLIQSLPSVSWPYQKYYLGFHHLPVIEEGVSPPQQQRV